jgi:hypothetical protein
MGSFFDDMFFSILLNIFFTGLIGGIGGLLILLGGLLIIIGRREFNEKHQKYTIYALFIAISNFIVVMILTLILLFLKVIGDTMVYAIPSIISAIIGTLAFIFLLYELEDQKGKKILYCAYITSILISILIFFLSTGPINEFFGSYEIGNTNLPSVFKTTSNLGRFEILNVLSYAFLFFAVQLPYKRISSGELIPKPIDHIGQQTKTAPDRICPNCGREIPFDALICSYCGKQFEK